MVRPVIANGPPLDTVKDGAASAARPAPELSMVELSLPVETKQGIIPAGSSGTVVHAYSDGQAYIIEFYEPFHTVATVEADATAP